MKQHVFSCLAAVSGADRYWVLLGGSAISLCQFAVQESFVQGLTISVVYQGGQFVVDFNLEHTSFSLFAGISVCICMFMV